MEPDGGHGEKSIETNCWAWFSSQEGAPSLRWRFAASTIYLLTLLCPMSMPSLSSSPWMRGAPQPGFSRHILRIRSRTSLEMTGRPGFPQRTFQVQNKRKAARCQATTVSGLTMASAERQSRQRRERQIHNSRSPRSISDVLLRTSETRRFRGAEPGSQAGEQHANGRSSTE